MKLASVLLACALGAGVPSVAAARAFEFKETGWEGNSELLAIARDRLGMTRVRLAATIPWDELQPSDALLVMHPEGDLTYRDVSAFLSAGGRLGLVDDYGKADTLLARFRIRRVRAPSRPSESLRDNPNLPIAVPALGTGEDAKAHPLLVGVDRVVTNHPTGLATEPGLELTTVLELREREGPATAFALIGVIGDAKRCGLVADGSEGAAPGGAGPGGRCGRLFAMGDPSAFMNLMLRYPGNRAFAARLVDYLVGDDSWGRRGGTLYLVANEFSERGSFGGKPGVLGGFDERLEALRRLIAETRRGGLPDAVALLLAVVTAGAAAVWAVLAATRRYLPGLPRYARPTPAVAQGGLAGRAAVLSAETTQRALVVLELKAALEETLRHKLALSELASSREITEEIDRRGALSRRSSKALGELLSEMARAEDAVTRAERIRVSSGAIRKMHDSVTELLTELDARLGTRP